MLTRYSDIKKEIILNGEDIRDSTIALSNQRSTVRKLEEHIESKKKDTELQIEKECANMLEKELAQEGSRYQYHERLLEQFKEKELGILAQIKYDIDTNSVVDSKDYDNNKLLVQEKFDTVSNSVLKYIDNSKLEAFRNVGYGINLIDVDTKYLESMLEYFNGYDDYDHLSKGIASLEMKTQKLEGETLLVLLFIVIALVYTFKVILILPYLVFILASLIIRLRGYYYLISLINAHLILQDQNSLMGDVYSRRVDSHIIKEESRLIDCRLELDQLSQKITNGINKRKSISLEKVKKGFNKEEARDKAKNIVADTTEKTIETLGKEKEKLEIKEQELQDALDKRKSNQEELVRLKEEIKNVYEQLIPSFKETSILTEFFLGFDDEDEPVTFDYKSSTTLILYDGSLQGQVSAVMSTLKMMCGQIMCAMYPLAYTLTIVDTLTSGAPLSAFQVTGEGEDLDVSNLFEVVSTNTDTNKFIDDLYFTMQTRRVKVLGRHKNIEEYNEEKKSFGARTMPYKLAFFYHFDYKLIHTNDKLKQLCRLSEVLGIIPILFVDSSSVGDEKRSADSKSIDERKYNYKSEIVTDSLELFNNNMFGFTIKDSVDIIQLSESKVKEILRRE